MGGSAASRLTNGGSGVARATLGAVGGGETETLTLAQLPTGIYLGEPCAGDQRERSVRAERTGYQLDASPRRADCPRRGNCRHSHLNQQQLDQRDVEQYRRRRASERAANDRLQLHHEDCLAPP
jgi:hypothetical protein